MNRYIKLAVISHLSNRKMYQIVSILSEDVLKDFDYYHYYGDKIRFMKGFANLRFPVCISYWKNRKYSRITQYFYDINQLSNFFFKYDYEIPVWKDRFPNFRREYEVDGLFFMMFGYTNDTDPANYTKYFIKFAHDFNKINSLIIKMIYLQNIYYIFKKYFTDPNHIPKTRIYYPKKIYDSHPLIRF